MNEEAELSGILYYLLMILVLVIVVVVAAWYYYNETPRHPENLDVVLSDNRNVSISGKLQFYPNMKFNHNKISYEIDSACEAEKQQRFITALNEIQNQVNEISFYNSENNSDIKISCSPGEEQTESDYFIAGEGGAKEVIQTEKYNVITNGVVLLYGDPKNSLKCDYPNVELHELMHVFGFFHSSNENSLMYPYLESCDQKLDSEIIEELKKLYAEENLPDLYFEDLKVVKKGKYLDFNVTIKNSGVIDSQGFNLAIYQNKELIETKSIGKIKYGAGLKIDVQNLKLKTNDAGEILFILDNKNNVKELDENNNLARINVQ